jgi:hypothetical protein
MTAKKKATATTKKEPIRLREKAGSGKSYSKY